MEVIKCKCVECTTSRVMDEAFRRDLQHLVLTLCRILFKNIQDKSPNNLQTLRQKVHHGDISCPNHLHSFVRTFKGANYLQFKSVTFNYTSSSISFNYQWNLKDQDLNLNHLIEISKYYYESFLSFVYKIDRWKRLTLKFLTNSQTLSYVEQNLPGFKYLYDFNWITDDSSITSFPSSFSPVENRLSESGVFFLASDFGVFIVVIVKQYYQDSMEVDDESRDYIELAKSYKQYAIEKHGNKLVTVIGAIFNEDPNCLNPLEFVDEVDYSIARSVQMYFDSTSSPLTLSIYQAPRQESAKPYELNPNAAIYGQPWDQQPQKATSQLLKMPLHPGKSAPIVGADWVYDKTSENDDFENCNYFKCPEYYNHNYYHHYEHLYRNF